MRGLLTTGNINHPLVAGKPLELNQDALRALKKEVDTYIDLWHTHAVPASNPTTEYAKPPFADYKRGLLQQQLERHIVCTGGKTGGNK